MVKLGLAWALIVALSVSARGNVVINEVLVNEPGAYQSLEWIELFVDSATSVSFDDCRLLVDGEEVATPPGLTPASREYLIICRRLTSGTGGSFEGYWGDSSGVWGDTDQELAMGEPIEASFSLRNTGGSIVLWQDGIPVSTFTWDDGGDDGVSFERIVPGGPDFAPCIARQGSTPGGLNSVTPAANDLAIASIAASVDDGLTSLRLIVANRGINTSGRAVVQLHNIMDECLLDSFPVDALLSGDSASVEATYIFESMRVQLAAAIPHDDRTDNDSLEFWAPGRDYPPVILSEIMPAPKTDSRAEWVELLSVCDEAVDLAGWRLGDSRKLCLISEDALILSPGERMVAAWDRSAFLAQYGYVPACLIELENWAQLNNGGDTVRLVDPYGLSSDAFGYTDSSNDDHTIGRREDNSGSVWGESVHSGGTPGEPNQVLVAGQASSLTMSITPQVFSPDGDGVDDTAVIHIDSPTMNEVTLKLYDREGQLAYDFRANEVKANDYVFYGTTNGGGALPIGIYIVYCEIDGQATKQAVVIARQ